MKLPLAIIVGVLLIYSWDAFLLEASLRQALVVFYIVTGFAAVALYKPLGKSAFREVIFFGCLLGASISLVDILVSSVFIKTILNLQLTGSAIKIFTITSGSMIFWAFQKNFYSTKSALFTSLGLLSRRITAGIIDIQIILLIITGLDILFSQFRMGQEIVLAMTIIVIFSYKAAYEAQYRQTPGKKLLGIKVSCSPIGAALRNIHIVFFFIAPYTGWISNILYLVVLIDTILFFTGKRLFDWLARTHMELSSNSQLC